MESISGVNHIDDYAFKNNWVTPLLVSSSCVNSSRLLFGYYWEPV